MTTCMGRKRKENDKWERTDKRNRRYIRNVCGKEGMRKVSSAILTTLTFIKRISSTVLSLGTRIL